jgi:MoaA/NifB/PqqE/SkfB family radical SAM enzyme
MSLFEKIVSEVETFPGQTVLRFLGRGESLLHSGLTDMIRFAKSRIHGKVALITNGHLLNASKGLELLEAGLDVLDISLDAVTQPTYNQVRSGNLALVENNILTLVKNKKEGGFKTKIMVSFLIQPENFREAVEFRSKWNGIVDKLIFRAYHSYGGKIAEKHILKDERYPCAALWSRVNIDDYGKVTLCYIDWDENNVLGDLNNDQITITNIWKTAYEKARQGHIMENYPPLCANCQTGWQAAHWGLSYEKAIGL